MSDENQNPNPDSTQAAADEADGSVTLTLRELNAQLAAARRSGEGKAARTGTREPSPIDKLTATVAQLAEVVARGAAPAAPVAATPSPPPAAAPSAPTGPVNPITTGGILDIFNLTPHQLQALGPGGVRKELDKIRDLHHQTSGLARLPRAPERNGGGGRS